MSLVTRVQKTFSELEYTGKKKQTRRDRFLADFEQLLSWAQLEAQVAPFYNDTTDKRGRPAIGVCACMSCSSVSVSSMKVLNVGVTVCA